MKKTKPLQTVTAYIAAAPKRARAQLKQIRAIIKAEAPQALEKISYRMPYYALHGRLVYFAAFRDHCSLFGAGMGRLTSELKKYKTSKGTIQFPLGRPLPVTLIKRLVKTRVKENINRAQSRSLKY